MKVAKFLSLKQLDEYLRSNIDELLDTHGVYNINNYGWLNEEDVDPEFWGLAYWQLDPPVAIDDFDGGIPSYSKELQSWQKFIAVARADFEGLMEASRLSIGLTLLQAKLGKTTLLDDNDSYFRLHLMESMVNLGMASDRLRDFFIAGLFRKSSPDYKKEGKYHNLKREWYETPFIEISELVSLNADSLVESMAKIRGLIDTVRKFRSKRNAIVHEVASELGRLHKELIHSERLNKPFDFELELGKPVSGWGVDTLPSEMPPELKDAINWYKILIEFANHVFIAEYEHRKFAPMV